jgi:DNA-binding transcriptional regulator LsrR (DeoR family)
VQNIIGVVNRPAANVLLLCDRVHHDTNEISASLALVQNAVRELLRRQSGAAETLAAQPCGHDFFPIGAALHRAITWDQNLVDRQVAAIDGKASRGQQHVIQEVGARTMAAHHEDGEVLAISWNGRRHPVKILPRKIAPVV